MSINIVEYDHSYSEALAMMWNLSNENWGGESTVKNAEFVRANQESSGNIKTFLALDGELVVGYCSFSNYKQDEGASYIPLLNVRPDYLGQKIGKLLVLRVVEEAIHASWPRLDLYTWQGNEKAVPLYKKCGFFWEKRDDSTHLMNFLPYVMRTEAVSKYFETIDWYVDSIREIEIASDGRTDGDFDYYDYVWEKDGMNLKMEFERRGRGLTSIETNDYLIRARVDKQKLVMGMDYDIKYEVINKSGKPLVIKFSGKKDKLIDLQLEKSVNVVDSETIIGSFHIDDTTDVQDKSKTHPCVSADVFINDEKAEFRVGINPKLPLEVKIGNFQKVSRLGETIVYIDIENGFDEEISFVSHLVDNEILNTNNIRLESSISPLGKVSIPVKLDLLNFGFYNESMSFDIQCDDKLITYNTILQGVFRGYTSKIHGEDKEQFYLVSGATTLTYNVKRNFAWLSHVKGKSGEGLGVAMPQLGKPYFAEFAGKKPFSKEFITRDSCETLVLTFKSEKKSGLSLAWYLELYAEGIVETYVKITNENQLDFDQICIKQNAYHLFEDADIPMDNTIVHVQNEDGFLPYMWNPKRLTENWVFSKTDQLGKALMWDKELKVTYSHQEVKFESEFNGLKANETLETKKLMLALNTFSHYKEIREFLGYDDLLEVTKRDLNMSLNDNNPFVSSESIQLKVEENKEVKPNYKATIHSLNKSIEDIREDVEFDDKIGIIELKHDHNCEIDIINVKLVNDTKWIKRDKAIFYKTNQEIQRKQYSLEGKNVYEISHDLLSIKASPEYGAGLFSLKFKDEEWLDHSFPEPSIKAWWNYWTGGIATTPENLSNASIYEETKKAEFVELKDSKGNNWTGIKTILDIVKHHELKGIKVEEYFMIMPGVPVMCKFSVVTQLTNEYKENMSYKCFGFLLRGDALKDNWVLLNRKDKHEKYYCSEVEFELRESDYIVHGSDKSEYTMTRLYNSQHNHSIENTNGVMFDYDGYKLNLEHGSQKVIETSFYVFSKELMDDLLLEDLKGIYFKV